MVISNLHTLVARLACAGPPPLHVDDQRPPLVLINVVADVILNLAGMTAVVSLFRSPSGSGTSATARVTRSSSCSAS